MKKISSAIIFLLCIAQVSWAGPAFTPENAPLTPPTRIDNVPFRQLCETICMALAVYRLDAVEGLRKGAIIAEHGRILSGTGVSFDLDRIDTKKKGWTRYYPVLVDGHTFIVRIFLTRESTYQAEARVLYEIRISDPEVTCQVLSSVNSIVESHKMTPVTPISRSPADTSL